MPFLALRYDTHEIDGVSAREQEFIVVLLAEAGMTVLESSEG
jgi:hypothetical protein